MSFKATLILLVFSLLCLAAFTKTRSTKTSLSVNQSSKHYIVAELFTSEGCSSCPPADEVINQLSKEAENNNEPIVFLNYHVDYWNQAWKDPFSNSDYTERQDWYKQFKKDDVYTPQMIVNGTTYIVGSHKTSIEQEIDKQLFAGVDTSASLASSISTRDNGGLKLKYAIRGKTDKMQLCVAVSEKNVHSDIKAGENKGRSINHSSVVRFFKVIANPIASNSVDLNFIPKENSDKYTVVAFLQRTDNGQIISVQPLIIP